MRISDWSSDVCSSDLLLVVRTPDADVGAGLGDRFGHAEADAAVAAGDQHGLAGEIEELVGHGRSLSLKTGAVRRRAEADRGARSPCRAPARRRARRREAVPDRKSVV